METVQPFGSIDLVTVRLVWREPWNGPPGPHLLRGALVDRIDDSLFHQHDPDTGECLYRYPRIHYRWDRKTGHGIIVGFGEGGYRLASIPFEGITLEMGGKLRRVDRATFTAGRHLVALSPCMVRYHLQTPWLALNQRCHDDWQRRTGGENAQWLDRHATASILTALRGLGLEVTGQVYSAFMVAATPICRYKDVDLQGFLGTLVTNLELPDGLGIGKAVSHGFGWLKKRRCESCLAPRNATTNGGPRRSNCSCSPT